MGRPWVAYVMTLCFDCSVAGKDPNATEAQVV